MISDLIKREYFLELCQKHEELENPYLDVNNLHINKYFLSDGDKKYFEIKYSFDLTSRIDKGVSMNCSKTKIFMYDKIISDLRNKRIEELLD
jgi:hypothetical protein